MDKASHTWCQTPFPLKIGKSVLHDVMPVFSKHNHLVYCNVDCFLGCPSSRHWTHGGHPLDKVILSNSFQCEDCTEVTSPIRLLTCFYDNFQSAVRKILNLHALYSISLLKDNIFSFRIFPN